MLSAQLATLPRRVSRHRRLWTPALAVAVVATMTALAGCGSSSTESAPLSADGATVSVNGPAGAASLKAMSSTPTAGSCASVSWVVSAIAKTNFTLATSDFVAVDATGASYTPLPNGGSSQTAPRGGTVGTSILFSGTSGCSQTPPPNLTLEYLPFGDSHPLAKWPQTQPAYSPTPTPTPTPCYLTECPYNG